MVGKAGHRHFPLLDTDDPLDDADVDVIPLERATLLDVQLEVAGDIALDAPRLRETPRITAEKRYAVADGLSAATLVLQLVGGELPTHGAAAIQSTLFVLPDGDMKRVARGNCLLA